MPDTSKVGFFYRLFMRRSPRSAMMFGLAVMLSALALFPHLLMQAMTDPAAAVRNILIIFALYLVGMIF